MGKSIVELVEELPKDNLTVKILNSLDFVVPGEWKNWENFDEAIVNVLNIDSGKKKKIKRIRDRAIELYEDKKNGYQTAVWLYQTVDKTDKAIAAATLADKIGDTFSFIPFLDKLTPKADNVQTVDLKMKLGAEAIAYSKINGLTLNPVKFAQSLGQHYRHESLMRMVALICIDGVIPLGADFVTKVQNKNDTEEQDALNNNPGKEVLSQLIPEDDPQNFLNKTFDAAKDWLNTFTAKSGLSRELLRGKFGGFLEIADDKLDYAAAFLDAGVNYMEHTGIQTVARNVIRRSFEEYREELRN